MSRHPAGAWEVARTYLVLGVEHILFGIDHLLFVLALLLVVKGAGRVVATVTAFTIAHSITLAAATLGLVRVPGPPVEAMIALSIVFVATEIVHGARGRPGLTARRPWIVAFTFGLLHGFGFAGALSEVGLPQNAIPLALFFFNVGVELGQLLFIDCVRGRRAGDRAAAYSVAALAGNGAGLRNRQHRDVLGPAARRRSGWQLRRRRDPRRRGLRSLCQSHELRTASPGAQARFQCVPATNQPDGQITPKSVQSFAQKYSASVVGQINFMNPAILSRQEGRRPSSRTLGQGAVDATCAQDEAA